MGPRRLSRSRVLRAIALGAAVAPLGLAWTAASCILADPPPSLYTIPPLQPQILVPSVVPPPGLLTNWPSGGLKFKVPVELLNPTITPNAIVLEDYPTPASSGTVIPFPMPDDAGVYHLGFTLQAPLDLGCHSIKLWVGDGPAWTVTNGTTVNCNDCTFVEWIYDPTGSQGCAVYDAGGLPGVPDAADVKVMPPD